MTGTSAAAIVNVANVAPTVSTPTVSPTSATVGVATDFSISGGEKIDLSQLLPNYNPQTGNLSDYVQAKQQAFHELYRVLKPGGRLSIFELINRFCYPEPPQVFMGYDVTPIEAIVGKVRAVFERIHEPASSPLLNFDERDLLTFAERARFAEIHLELQATIKQPRPLDSHDETSRLALGNALARRQAIR